MKSLHTTILTLLLLATAGCSSKSTAPTEGAILNVNLGAEVQDLDPHIVTGVPEHRATSALFEGLTDLNPATMEAIPAAATSWEVSEDKTVYTFHLRKEAMWSNGDAVTAHDFAYAWRRMLTPALGAEYAYLLYILKNAQAYHEGALTDFDEVGVKVVDDYTLEVTLAAPTPYFITSHIHYAWYPLHQATIEAHGAIHDRGTKWTRVENFVGNGAFILTEWAPNEVMTLAKNPRYWNRNAVKLDGINFYPIDDLQTEERSFRSGDLHVTEDIPLHRIQVYQAENPAVLKLAPYLGVYYYRINVTKPPFDDKRVRQAFSMALNREVICRDVMKAGEAPAFTYVPPNCGTYTSAAPLKYDPEAAKALLTEAGYPNGEGLPKVEMLYNTSDNHKRIAEAMQNIWKQNLGTDAVRLLNQDWKVYLSSMNALDYQMARSGWIADVVDPINFLECFLSNSGNNRTGFKSPAYDALIEQAYIEPDIDKRNAVMQEAEAILLDEAVIIPIYFYTRKFLMATEVKGYIDNPLGYMRWEDFYLETIDAEGKV